MGASGDLAPLSHLALGMMGEGHMWSPSTGWGEARYVLESHNLTPIKLGAKEGLALINGTQLITSIGAEAVERAGIVARQADVVAALTLEVLKGTSRAFDSGKKLLDFFRVFLAIIAFLLQMYTIYATTKDRDLWHAGSDLYCILRPIRQKLHVSYDHGQLSFFSGGPRID